MKAPLVVAAIVVAGVTGAGITLLASGQPATVVRDVPGPVRTHTRVVTRTVTHTVRTTTPGPVRTVDVPGPTGIPCAVVDDPSLPDNGDLFPFPHGAIGVATETTCTITAITPYALGEWQATAPGGQTATFTVVAP